MLQELLKNALCGSYISKTPLLVQNPNMVISYGPMSLLLILSKLLEKLPMKRTDPNFTYED